MISNAAGSIDGTMVGGKYDEISFSHRNWFVKNYSSTEWNQRIIFDWLSRYLTQGENPELLNTRLPIEKQQIINYCSANTRVSDHIYHKEGDFFYVVKTEANDNELSLEVFCENNSLSKLRNLLMGWPIAETVQHVSVIELDSFVSGQLRYSIIYENAEYPIVNILCNNI